MHTYENNTCAENRQAVRDTLDVIGGKWKILILLTLKDGSFRFNELAKEIGITPRMLSKELQDLEMNKLVERKVLDTKPVGVEYYITEYGLTFQDVIEALRDWGMRHRRKIMGTS
ncbi:MAG: helix-turn-helix domain-containing protein [Balneolaceae bacterium]